MWMSAKNNDPGTIQIKMALIRQSFEFLTALSAATPNTGQNATNNGNANRVTFANV